MSSYDFNLVIQIIVISIPPALLGIILHEVAHGWVACRLGDPTARMLGRLTLNPIPHIDPIGLLVFFLSLLGGFAFGWAKPVPVNPRYFRNPAKGMMLVALAGPCANLLLAFLMTLILGGLENMTSGNFYGAEVVALMLGYGIRINIGLACINLVPIPPLDGSKILAYFLPFPLAMRYMSIERYGFVILLILMATGILGMILSPVVSMLLQLMSAFLPS